MLPALPHTSLLPRAKLLTLQSLTLKMPAKLILESTFWVIDIPPPIPSHSCPSSHHLSAPLCFPSVSFAIFVHWSVLGAETAGRAWIYFFLETSGHPYSRDPLTFFFKSCLCSCTLWASSSSTSSAPYIPNCLSLPQ